MSLPSAWSTVPITGTFVGRDGQPVEGVIKFDSKQFVSVGGKVVVPRTITVQLVNGSIPAGFVLPSTDDPDLNITGWTYSVSEGFSGGRTYDIFVPAVLSTSGLDLAAVSPAVSPAKVVDTRGARGASAYEIAVAQGFIGSEQQWLNSFGSGASAYEIALEAGFVGSMEDWLASLQGDAGPASTVPGPAGASAYQVATSSGFVGTAAQWLASLKGATGDRGDDGVPGTNGRSAYQIAVDNGFVGTEVEWLESLKGAKGDAGGTGGTFSLAVIGAKTRSLEEKGRDFPSILDFEGVNPNSTTSSHTAFRSAMEANLGAIDIPKATFRMPNLVIDRQVDFRARGGRTGTIIEISGSGGIHGLDIIGDATLNRANTVRLSGFTLRYVGAGQTLGTDYSGIAIRRKVIMDEVDVEGFTNDGIRFLPSNSDIPSGNLGTNSWAPFFCDLVRVRAKDNGRDGIAIVYGANANNFYNCDAARNGRYGIYHASTTNFATYGNNFFGGQCAYNKQEGYRFESGTNITTWGIYSELNGVPDHTNTAGAYTNTPYDIWVGDNCSRSIIHVGVLYNSDTSKVRQNASNETMAVIHGGMLFKGSTARKIAVEAANTVTLPANATHEQLRTAFEQLLVQMKGSGNLLPP